MNQNQKPVAVVRPLERDPIIVETEEKVREIARLIFQRREDQRHMEELLQRWETRSEGRAMEPELKALGQHIEEKLEEFVIGIQQLDPNCYPDYTSCYRQLLKMHQQDENSAKIGSVPHSRQYGEHSDG